MFQEEISHWVVIMTRIGDALAYYTSPVELLPRPDLVS